LSRANGECAQKYKINQARANRQLKTLIAGKVAYEQLPHNHMNINFTCTLNKTLTGTEKVSLIQLKVVGTMESGVVEEAYVPTFEC